MLAYILFKKTETCAKESGMADYPEAEKGKRRALVLFSGGLDSMLAVELLRRCGVDVMPMTFTTPFFGSGAAEKAADDLELELQTVDITASHLEMLKKPRYGYGRNMNPCIDCHALMVRVALERLEDMAADFVATGEVLGERPKSQNRQALELVSRSSGAGDLLLRPLSARLLPETRPEMEGWVDRESLLDLSGRSRRRQMDLAEEWGIEEYQSPAGGCLLTDASFSARLRELMARVPDFDGSDAEAIRGGRIFWTGSTLIVLGRRHEENLRLMQIALPGDILLREKDAPGPTALLRAYPRGAAPNKKDLKEASRLLGIYGKGKMPLKPHMVVEIDKLDYVI
jgi:tRNA-specific 2-thiouridylase